MPIDSLKKRVENLESVSQKVIQINDSLITVNNNLNKQIDYNERLISRYDTLNNTIFTIIGIILALFAILAPLIGYFFVIKPSKEKLLEVKEKLTEAQKLLDDTRHNVDKLFAEYLQKNRDNFIDKALTQIESDNTPEIANSINCLDIYKHEGFNDKQILRIITLIKNKHDKSNFFMKILGFTESIFTTEFFRDYLKNNPSNKLSNWAALYAAKYDKEDFLDDIAEYIIVFEDLKWICSTIKNVSPSYLIKLYNNEKLTNGIDSHIVISHMSNFDTIEETSQEKMDRQNSKLFKKYIEITEPKL